jgi:hypothetical protein
MTSAAARDQYQGDADGDSVPQRVPWRQSLSGRAGCWFSLGATRRISFAYRVGAKARLAASIAVRGNTPVVECAALAAWNKVRLTPSGLATQSLHQEARHRQSGPDKQRE